MKTVVVLAMHGMPPVDFPTEELAEFFKLHSHFSRASDERIGKIIADLKDMGIQKLGVSHCTGFRASARLAQEFGNAFFLNNVGTRLTLS